MKDDYISRQAAIDELKKHRALYCDNTPYTFSILSYAEKSRVDELDTAIATLVNLPSAEPRTEWIPVSERLPEAGQGCLVCHNGAIGIDTFIGHDHPYKWNLYVRDYDAWMPLPEPWRGGE